MLERKKIGMFWLLVLPTFLLGQTIQLESDSILKQVVEYQGNDEYEKAIDLIQVHLKSIEKDSFMAILWHKLGVSQYYLSENEAAIQAWKQAFDIWKMLYPNHIQIIQIREYRNLGNAYVELGNHEEASQYFKQALQWSLEKEQVDQGLLTNIYQEFGNVLSEKNDFAQAETYLRAALGLSKKIYSEEPWEIAYCYNLLLILCKQQHRPTCMIEYAFNAINIYEQIEDKYDEDYWNLADIYNNLAIAYEWQNDYEHALEYYNKSLSINLLYKEERSTYLAENHNNIATLFQLKGEESNANKSIQKAIDLDRINGNARALADDYNTQGSIFLSQGNTIAALEAYQKSIAFLVQKFQPESVHQLPKVSNAIVSSKAQLIENLFDKTKAYQVSEQKLAIFDSISILIDQLRMDFESDESKNFLASKAKGIYQEAVDLSLELYERTQNASFQKGAFNYAERSKALVLLEAVKESNVKQRMGIDVDWLTREKELKQQIAKLKQELFESEEANELRLQIIDLQQDLEQLVQELERKNPNYYQLKYQVELPQILTIQQELADNEAILEYLVGEKKIYWFYIQSDQLESGSVRLDFPLKNWVQDFRFSIANKNRDDLNQDSLAIIYADLGYRLYEKLFQPIAEKTEIIHHLRIIPDGVLGYLPFDALLTEQINENTLGKYANYPFLHHDFRISYNYSIALAQEMKQMQHTPKYQQLLAFAPAFESKKSVQLGNVTLFFNPLRSNIKSTEDLLKNFKGKSYLEAQATKTNFLEEASNYAYLHLSSHAKMNDENANYSFISFAQMKDTISKDQLLFVSELYNLKLNAEMVVLSACETGLGELKEGEGIISLARAFSYAGAKSIITSLWQVDDQKTGELMLDFYKNLEDGLSKDEALHQAKQNMIASGFQAHPYYWAGFIGIGDMEILEKSANTFWILGLIGCLALALALIFLFWKKKNI